MFDRKVSVNEFLVNTDEFFETFAELETVIANLPKDEISQKIQYHYLALGASKRMFESTDLVSQKDLLTSLEKIQEKLSIIHELLALYDCDFNVH